MPNRIKYASTYGSLQDAFDDLQPKDTLFIDQDYDLLNTVYLRQRDVLIMGRGSTIKRAVGANPSMILIQIDNSIVQWLTDIVIDGLRFENPIDPVGSGTGVAINIIQTNNNGGVYHIKLQNMCVGNFFEGILLRDSFDIVIDNCQISGNLIGIRSEYIDSGVGQIKIFGGFFTRNTYGVSIDDSSGSEIYQGQIMAFGATFGHARDPNVSDLAIGVYVGKPIGGVFLSGSHFEDLSNVLYYADNFPNNTSDEPMVICASGNMFYNIRGTYCIDTRNAKPAVSAVSISGNYNFRAAGTMQIAAVPKIHTQSRGGALVAGNSLTAYPNPEFAAFQQNSNQVYPVPVFDAGNRPAATSVPKGSVILNATTNQINVSNGTTWKKADGTSA